MEQNQERKVVENSELNVSIKNGIAFLPNGEEIKLGGIQSLLEESFSETNDDRFGMAAHALSSLTLMKFNPERTAPRTELPGMWDSSDFEGGETDMPRRGEQTGDSKLLSNVEQLMAQVFEKSSQSDRDATICRLKAVHPSAAAACEGFEYQMRGVGALSETATVSPLFSDATVGGVQSMLFKALKDDEARQCPDLAEFAFDCKLTAAIRVKAKSRAEAEAILRETLDAASCNAGLWDNGDPIVFEASLDADTPLDLYEVNGEPPQAIKSKKPRSGPSMM